MIEAAGELKTKPTQHSVNELRRIGISPDVVVCRSSSPLSRRAARQDRAVRRPRRARRDRRRGRARHLPRAAPAARAAARRPRGRAPRRSTSTPPDLVGVERAVPTASSTSRGAVRIAHRRQVRRSCSDAYLSVDRGAQARRDPPRRRPRDRVGRRREPQLGRGRGAPPPRRRHPHPRRLRPARDRGQGRGRPLRARGARRRSSASASACSARSSSSPATSSGWRARTRPSSTRETPYPVVDLLPEQRELDDKGGTMRLGAEPVRPRRGHAARTRPTARRRSTSATATATRSTTRLRPQLEAAGLVVSGVFASKNLVEVVELPDHPFFVASQFHPEFKSRPTRPQPLFRDFVGAAVAERDRRAAAVPATGSGAAALTMAAVAASDVLELFLSSPRSSSPSGGERAGRRPAAPRYLRELGLEVRRGRRRRARSAAPPATSTAGSRRPHGETAARRSSSAPTRTPCRTTRRSSRSCSTALVDERRRRRSSAPTTRRPSPRMLDAVRQIVQAGMPHAGIELVLTAQEEVGLRGAKAFDHDAPAGARRLRLRPRLADRRDGASTAPSQYTHRRALPSATRRTRASRRRRAAARSPRRRARSPRCGSAASTTRRPRTSG